MSGLFHARIPLSHVHNVVDVTADTSQHHYQPLTKYSARLRRLVDVSAPRPDG